VSRRRRAVALLVAIFFMVLLYLLMAAFLRVIPFELSSARRDLVRSQSYYFAAAMSQTVRAWLCHCEDTTGEPTQSLSGSDTANPLWPRRYFLHDGSVAGLVPHPLRSDGGLDTQWRAELELYPDAVTAAGGGPHVFKLRVRSYFQDMLVTSHEYLLQQVTFAKYGFFVDKLPNSGFYTAMKADIYEGEFHVNGKMPLYVDPKLFSEFVEPVFRGKLTFTKADPNNPHDGITYQSGSAKPFDASGNPITDADGLNRYSKLASQGKPAIQITSDVAMPQTNLSTELPLAKAAWFGRNSKADSLASQSITNGIHVPRNPDGSLCGIYVKGSLRNLDLGVENGLAQSQSRDAEGFIDSGNPTMTFQEESNAAAGQNLFTKITELRDESITLTLPAGSRYSLNGGVVTTLGGDLPVSSGKTVIRRDPGTARNPGPEVLYEVHDGFPNGVIFIDGNLGKVPALNTEQSGGSSVNRDYLRSTTASTGGLSGINYGAARTIAVNLVTNRYLRLKGDITRGDAKPGSVPRSRRDGLGLVGYDVVVGREIPRNGDTQPFYLYSLLFAGRRDVAGTTQPGSVIYEDWDTRTGWGRLFSYGSYVVGQDRLWGNNGTKGWMPTFRHDFELANTPPPFYPTRSDFKMQAYQEIAQ